MATARLTTKLNILVLHGYCRSAATTAQKTRKLRDALDGVAVLHYVDGPPMPPYPSRPWWIMDQAFEFDSFGSSRWDDVVKWWSKELSERHYDGIIGLSQGSAMAALLLSMINHPERVPAFSPTKKQDFKFGIFCSGFISHISPHTEIYGIPDIPILHTIDDGDTFLPAARNHELHGKCGSNSVLYRHNEGHEIPVGGNFPKLFRDFILEATK
ncbi:serine hydrolase FSH [Mycena albidolilacea]|uniref:Serine hydrolase FSH n=1 Tax=Mycena albidolilacea TaxID=1033008 RepID=A0AAD6ZRR2_9AGAR|nr:serine hydrolase FSH [Mycena albidolilacea]